MSTPTSVAAADAGLIAPDRTGPDRNGPILAADEETGDGGLIGLHQSMAGDGRRAKRPQ